MFFESFQAVKDLDQKLRLFARKELARLDEIHWSPARNEFGERPFTTEEFQHRFEAMILRKLEREILPELYRQGSEVDSQTEPAADSESMSSELLRNSRRRSSDPARWQAIEITFLDEHQVTIRDGGRRSSKLSYEELGFKDRRNGLPNSAWDALRLLAQASGVIPDGRHHKGKWSIVEKRMQEARKGLRRYFRISADPLPFVPGTGYRALFKIHYSPSYDR